MIIRDFVKEILWEVLRRMKDHLFPFAIQYWLQRKVGAVDTNQWIQQTFGMRCREVSTVPQDDMKKNIDVWNVDDDDGGEEENEANTVTDDASNQDIREKEGIMEETRFSVAINQNTPQQVETTSISSESDDEKQQNLVVELPSTLTTSNHSDDNSSESENLRNDVAATTPPQKDEGCQQQQQQQQGERYIADETKITTKLLKVVTSGGGSLGIRLTTELVVQKVTSHSKLLGKVHVGDKLVAINGTTVDGWKPEDIPIYLHNETKSKKQQQQRVYLFARLQIVSSPSDATRRKVPTTPSLLCSPPSKMPAAKSVGSVDSKTSKQVKRNAPSREQEVRVPSGESGSQLPKESCSIYITTNGKAADELLTESIVTESVRDLSAEGSKNGVSFNHSPRGSLLLMDQHHTEVVEKVAARNAGSIDRDDEEEGDEGIGESTGRTTLDVIDKNLKPAARNQQEEDIAVSCDIERRRSARLARQTHTSSGLDSNNQAGTLQEHISAAICRNEIAARRKEDPNNGEEDKSPEIDQCGDATCVLLEEEEQKLLTGFDLLLLKQLRICQTPKKGFRGMECVHCNGDDEINSGKRFQFSAVTVFFKNFKHFHDHIMECSQCPKKIKHALNQQKKNRSNEMNNLSKGSKLTVVQRLWCQMGRKGGGLPSTEHKDTSEDVEIIKSTKKETQKKFCVKMSAAPKGQAEAPRKTAAMAPISTLPAPQPAKRKKRKVESDVPLANDKAPTLSKSAATSKKQNSDTPILKKMNKGLEGAIEEKTSRYSLNQIEQMSVEKLSLETGEVLETFGTFTQARKSVANIQKSWSFFYILQGRNHTNVNSPHVYKGFFWRFQGSNHIPAGISTATRKTDKPTKGLSGSANTKQNSKKTSSAQHPPLAEAKAPETKKRKFSSQVTPAAAKNPSAQKAPSRRLSGRKVMSPKTHFDRSMAWHAATNAVRKQEDPAYDDFYFARDLIRFNRACLNWKVMKGGPLNNYKFVVGDGAGPNGKEGVDFFYKEKPVVEYCKKNKYREKYAKIYDKWMEDGQPSFKSWPKLDSVNDWVPLKSQ